MLAIGLSNIEELHICRITFQNLTEQVSIVFQILFIKRQTKLGIKLSLISLSHTHFFQLLLSTHNHRIGLNRSRFHSSRIWFLCHTIMNRFYISLPLQSATSEGSLLLIRQWLTAMEKVTTRTLGTRNIRQTTSMENANGIRRPRSREVKTRSHLCQILLVIRSFQKGFSSKTRRIVALAEKPCQNLQIKHSPISHRHLILRQLRSHLKIVAELGFNLLNLLRDILSGFSKQTVGGSLCQTRSTKVVNYNFSARQTSDKGSYSIDKLKGQVSNHLIRRFERLDVSSTLRFVTKPRFSSPYKIFVSPQH